MENTQRILILYAIMLSLNYLNAEEGATAAKRYLFINAAELIQDRYVQNTLTSEFGSKDMILWKGGSSFVFTEDETLWIASIPIWYDRQRPPERLLSTPSKNYFIQLSTETKLANRFTVKDLINSAPIQQEEVWREITTSIFPDIVYKCSFTFIGGYGIDMNNLLCYGF